MTALKNYTEGKEQIKLSNRCFEIQVLFRLLSKEIKQEGEYMCKAEGKG